MMHCTFFLEEDRYFGELKNDERATLVYRYSVFKNRLIQLLFNIVLSKKVNRNIIRCFTAKKLFYKWIIKKYYVHGITNVFIFHAAWYDEKLTETLEGWKSIIKVLYFEDTVSFYARLDPRLNPYNLSKEFDYIFSCNPYDVRTYNFIQSNAFFSKVDLNKIPCKDKETSDIVFIGNIKDRLDLLNKVYEKLSKECKCTFMITHYNNKSPKSPGIRCLKETISYEDYLGYELNSKCLLEILKKDTEAHTLRCWEAVYYNKKLLTNWEGIKDFKYYNPRYMMYFKTVDEIDVSFILNNEIPSYNYEGENSPLEFLNSIFEIVNCK